MSQFLIEAAGMLLRWLHIVAAIAWIGESFYFVMLDRALKPPKAAGSRVLGELWSVHGGGFYHKQKYAGAPAQMPEDLHWSKWKSYTTWLSGAALFILLYLRSPEIYLIDPAVAALSPTQAVLLAIAFPIGAWVLYDVLCRMVGFRERLLGVLVGSGVLLMCYALTHLFAGRAAFLLAGSVLATIMSANVFLVIIPGQKRMVAALARGEVPDPLPGRRGKQRSVHNTYFTLPVVFAMMSIHFASAYAHPHSWILLAVFMGGGALIRQFFVLWHGGERAWWLLAAGAIVVLAALAWMAPALETRSGAATLPPASASAGPPAPTALQDRATGHATEPPSIQAVQATIGRHCVACHSAKPALLASAPLGLVYDTPQQILAQRERIHQQTVVLRVMPPGNLTRMTEAERALLDRWFSAEAQAAQ